MCRGRLTVGIACWAVSILLGGNARAQTYAVFTLPDWGTCAININNQFQILATAGGFLVPREAVIWDRAGRHNTGIDARPPDLRLTLNDAGAIAGIANGQLFVWGNGTTTFLPIPTDRTGIPDRLRKFTNSGIVLFETTLVGSGTWAFDVRSMRLFDLSAITGAFIADINDDGVMGGSNYNGRPYLRFPDGRTAVPWPERVGVDRVGPGGHFAGGNKASFSSQSFPAVLLYGSPDGSVTRIPLADAGTLFVFDINRRGDVLGVVSPRFGRARRFLYTDGRLIEPPKFPRAINDAGYMLGGDRDDFINCSQDLLIPHATAPAGVAFRVAGRTVTLNWQETYGALDYILEAGSSAGSSDIFVGSIGGRTLFTATVPPGRYYVRLRARNDAGPGPPSDEMIIDVP